jgi:hypothetical protein
MAFLPRTALDIVARAEIAGYHALWKRPCDSWGAVRARLDEEYGEDRDLIALVLAVLWLADHREDAQLADLVS